MPQVALRTVSTTSRDRQHRFTTSLTARDRLSAIK